jgi:hypothetical protein
MHIDQCCMNTSFGETPKHTTTSGNAVDQYLGFCAIVRARDRITATAFAHIGWFTSAVAVSTTGWSNEVKVSA